MKKSFPLLLFLCLFPFNKTMMLNAQSESRAGATPDLADRAPVNPALPSIFVIGDSTADFHRDTEHQGAAGVHGWGSYLQCFFDTGRVNIVNAAVSGRSSRTYITEGHLDKVLAMLKPHDIVLIQLGQNDVFPINDDTRARGTLPGVGPETQQIVNGVTHQPETVHTYGWYLRQIVDKVKARGAQPVVLSLTPRNVWKDGHVEIGVGEYRAWARTVAIQENNIDFVDVSAIVAREFEKLGQDKVAGLYHEHEQVHMNAAGALLTSELIVSGLKSLLDLPVDKYLSRAGEMVSTADNLAFRWPANPALPTLWILGDSTVRNGDGTGIGGMWGWGDLVREKLNSKVINVANVAISGFSSRTYYTRQWPMIKPHLRRGDIVLMQFGHNDQGRPDDPTRARASLPGIGEESKHIQNPLTGLDEEVHTYGWYMRQFIADARGASAIPVITTAVPRNSWKEGKIVQEPPVEWAQQVAHQQQAALLNTNQLLADRYQTWGREKTTALFADQGTHSSYEGAGIVAGIVLQELAAQLPDSARQTILAATGH
jgi:lysophospholipase L1-like esterase